MTMEGEASRALVRHGGEALRERSKCGWRDRLISRENDSVAAWVHVVDLYFPAVENLSRRVSPLVHRRTCMKLGCELFASALPKRLLDELAGLTALGPGKAFGFDLRFALW
jgi:hypothetical protein